MLTKIVLSAAFVLGAVSVASAYEEPENRIADRYPFLEQFVKPIRTAEVGNNRLMARPVVNPGQVSYEEPENRIADRYPLLEPFIKAQVRAGAKTRSSAATIPHLKPFTVAEKMWFDRQTERFVF